MNPNSDFKNNESVMAVNAESSTIKAAMPSLQLLMQVMPSQEFQSMLPALLHTAMSV